MNNNDRRGNSPLVKALLFVMLLVRRCYPIMKLFRWVYRTPAFSKLRKPLDSLLDPNSISRHSNFAIPTKFIRVEGLMGESMRVNLGDHIGYRIFMDGYFDLAPALVAIAMSAQNPRAFYLDIGANIGDTSISVAQRGIHTVGVDASTLAISELCYNLTLNAPLPYTVVHAAVASESLPLTGEGTSDYLTIHTPVGNTGAASVHAEWNQVKSSDLQMLSIPRRISDIVRSLLIREISVIKLDVEGAEYAAIEGMVDLLDREKCPLIFEYRIDRGGSNQSSASEAAPSILDVLPADYVCYAVECSNVTGDAAVLKFQPFDREQPYENVLAVYQSLPDCLSAAGSANGLTIRFG
ncbi:MAG: FkbM family methyltransferase [Rubripirellula sp.]